MDDDPKLSRVTKPTDVFSRRSSLVPLCTRKTKKKKHFRQIQLRRWFRIAFGCKIAGNKMIYDSAALEFCRIANRRKSCLLHRYSTTHSRNDEGWLLNGRGGWL